MPEWVIGTFEFLVGMNMHPMVTVVVFLILLVSRLRFEEPHIQAAKDAMNDAAKATPEQAAMLMTIKKIEGSTADRISQIAIALALAISVAGQFALYWPHSGQARALCAFFSLAQLGMGILALFFVDKFGLLDRIGKYFQKKVDEKLG